MLMPLHAVEALLRELLPIEHPRLEYGFAPDERAVFENEEGVVGMTIQLVVYEAGPERHIREVKAQEVCILLPAHREDAERVAAYFRAWSRAVPALVERHFAGDLESLMPHDLVFPEALEEEGARTVDEFLSLFRSDEVIERWLRKRQEEEFAYELAYFGFADHVEGLVALRRPSVRLVVDAEEEEDDDDDEDDEDDDEHDAAARDSTVEIPVGASHIGGLPDLPPGVAWPRIEGAALSFLAQIRLADLADLPGAEELPQSGLLSFFYDADSRTNQGEDGKFQWPAPHRGGARVLHFEGDPSTFVRTEPPVEETAVVVFPAYAVGYQSERMMPPMESPFYDLVDPDSVKDAAWYARFAQIADMNRGDTERPIHRLLGYTSELQGDPYLSVHTYASGQKCEDRDPAQLREAARWRLLLQIDSEPGNKLLNQDGGYYYFLIREDDLAQRRFDRVWGELQCH